MNVYFFLSFFPSYQVLLARHKSEKTVHAVKVLNKVAIMKRNEARHIMSERNVLLKNIKHPFLVSLRYSFQVRLSHASVRRSDIIFF